MIPKTNSFLWAVTLAIALPSKNGAATVTSAPPNLIVILADDMAYGDVGSFGSRLNPTPNLDRMAQEGMRLTSFYAAPVCSASRAQLLTGCYAPRVSMPGVLGMGDPIGLNPGEMTIPRLLKQRRYATMMIGKWHLGDQPEFFPTRFGFDRYFGLPYSNDEMLPAAPTKVPVLPLMRDDHVIELLTEDEQNTLTERYTDEAVNYLRSHRHQQQPFFLYLAHAAVHYPIHPGVRWTGKSRNGRFGDWVAELDWSVGRILEVLREEGLADNTLVVFTSDNGPWLIHGKDAGTAFPLRGGKGSTWEGGLREPAIAWWPGHVPAGTTSKALTGTIDLLPTFAALAGVPMPADLVIDGTDIHSLLLGQADKSGRAVHYYYLNWQLQAVREGPWKLALQPQLRSMQMKEGGVKTPGLRLYNLDADIGERVDVAAQNPEIVQRLSTLAKVRLKSFCSDSPTGPGVRPPGWVENPRYLVSVPADYRPPAWIADNYRSFFPHLTTGSASAKAMRDPPDHDAPSSLGPPAK